ncbi:MAG: dienelactone hydrolase family protein [candidate division NC10 bacterium]|nr:dienelactone hydrolase family protein [candidate division NC10 bacterium]
MPEGLATSMVEFRSDGVTVIGYLARPKAVGTYPGVIVVQEWWGLNDHIKDIARRLAQEGYIALAPDLYSSLGHQVTTDPNQAGQLMRSLRQEDGLKDLNAAVRHLKAIEGVEKERIGVIGFCMGGTYALLLPCHNKDIKAAAPFYGQIPSPDDPLKNLACPVLYLYGEEDGWITMQDVNRLREALKRYHKSGEVVTYLGCPHAFFNDTRKDVYREREARDAWGKVLRFFEQHLKG